MAWLAAIPALASAASSASSGGKKGGGGGGSAPTINFTRSPLERMQTQIARQLFMETTPLRTGLMASLQDILGMPRTVEPQTASWVPGIPADKATGVKGTKGRFKFTSTPGMEVNPFGIYGQAKESLEQQYPVAREAVLSTIPGRGGQLNDQLFNLEKTRASEVGGLRERVITNALGLASGAAFGTPAALSLSDNSFQRQAMAAQLQSNFAAQNGQAGAQKKSGATGAMGQLGGAAISALASRCWIAAAIYGPFTYEFHMARAWIFERWEGRTADCLRWLYLRVGRRVAHYRRVCRLMKPLFDSAVRKAEAAL